jgi:spore coat polysaccharide biosynthesis protein SpsF
MASCATSAAACLDSVSCSWFFRVCADSPLLEPSLFGTMLQYATRDDVDLISNVFPRTFPKGQSLEMVKTRTFQEVDAATLTPEQRQHVTRVFYDHSSDYRIVNVTSDDPALGQTSVAVDTLDDLYALERRWFVQGAHAG